MFEYKCVICGKTCTCDGLYADAIDNGRAEMTCETCENGEEGEDEE